MLSFRCLNDIQVEIGLDIQVCNSGKVWFQYSNIRITNKTPRIDFCAYTKKNKTAEDGAQT